MLVNFDQSSDTTVGIVINDVVRLSYAFHVMFVFPIINYTLRANLDELFFPNSHELANDTPRFLCLTCILVALAYAIAIWIPSIWYCFQILGSTTVAVMMIFPAFIILRLLQYLKRLLTQMEGAY